MFPSRQSKIRRSGRITARAAAQAVHPEPLEPRWLFAGISGDVAAGFTTFNAVGTANTTASIAAFQSAIGGVDNANVAAEQSNGSRRINWDGVKLDGTDFNGQTQTIVPNKVVGIPVNRFQTRGALFGEVYAVSGDGFASVNPGVAGQINPFSPKNTFGHFNDIDIDTSFIKPSTATTSPVQQGTRGFGAIFLDVEQSNSSYIEYFHNNDSLGKFFVQPGASGQPEFLGVLFNSPVVTKVEVHPGSSPLFFFHNGHVSAGQADISKGGTEDMAAVDDFLYAEPASVANTVINHATEGKSFTGTVGKFTTSNSNPHASDFTATINWGDGTSTSAGTVLTSGSGFAINGTHTYKEEGTFRVTVSIKDKSGHTGTARSISEVADAPLSSSGLSFNASNQAPFTGTVAKFSDADTSEIDATTYNALINWGDGTSTVGQIVSLGSGKWAVRGVHQYANAGTFNVKITIDDIGGSTTTASSTAHVI
ncbi:MAG TPA: hypothetical protein VLI90_12635 [Tepidisphaeraceae bacterium]|nr:hypothetical protein [Tepidisphaeraceae bacterium]